MRSTWILACAVVAIGSGLAGALPPPAPPLRDKVTVTRVEPLKRSLARMEFKELRHDFGPMMDNEEHFYSFEFVNSGSEPLEIISVTADCGCTVPELKGRLFQPGETGSVDVTFDPEGKSGDLVRFIQILSNQSSGGEISLGIAAQVTPIVQMVPEVLTVGVTERDRPISRTMTVTGRTADFMVTGVETSTKDDFTARIIGTESVTNRAGEKLRRSTIEVTFTPKRRIGDYLAQLKIETNDPRRATIRAQLIGRVHGDLYTKPRSITMRGLRVGTPVDRKVLIRSRKGNPFNVLGVEFSEGNIGGVITFEPKDPENPVEWLISFTGTPTVTETRLAQQLLVKTDVDGEEVVRIEMRGVVRDGE